MQSLEATPTKPKHFKDIDNFNPALPLDNQKHEEFCFRYVLVGNATQAYEDVYKVIRAAANAAGARLLANVCVRKRVDFIQQAQTDSAFSTIVRNFQAKKTIVHDVDAVLTEIDDPQAQIAAATVALKVGGKLQINNIATGNITNNYNTLNISQVVALGDVVNKLSLMNMAINERKQRTVGQKAISDAVFVSAP